MHNLETVLLAITCRKKVKHISNFRLEVLELFKCVCVFANVAVVARFAKRNLLDKRLFHLVSIQTPVPRILSFNLWNPPTIVGSAILTYISPIHSRPTEHTRSKTMPTRHNANLSRAIVAQTQRALCREHKDCWVASSGTQQHSSVCSPSSCTPQIASSGNLLY